MGKTQKANKGSLAAFFILLLALSLPFLLLGALSSYGLLMLPFQLPISALMFVCPSIAALILVKREEPDGGAGKLLRATFSIKGIRPAIWYVPILLLMPLIMFLSYQVMIILRRTLPVPEFSYLSVPALLVIFFIAAAGEEIGWSGYVTERLRTRWNALQTGIILGTIWALWHVIPYIQAHRSLQWILWQCLFTIVARILIVWLYSNTHKGIIAAILFHMMVNVTYSLFPNGGSAYDPAITAILAIVAATLVTFLWGAKTLANYRYANRVTPLP